jgi:hypothetical protein
MVIKKLTRNEERIFDNKISEMYNSIESEEGFAMVKKIRYLYIDECRRIR